MRLLITKIFLVFALHFTLGAQVNLVPNGNFENYVQCPSGLSELYQALYWENPSLGTPDYLNTCSSAADPLTWAGGQVPKSGAGVAGIICYSKYVSSPNDREYIQIELLDTLNFNQKYIISFFISLGDQSNYSISNIGCYFSNSPINETSTALINLTPQFSNPTNNQLNNKNSWTEVMGTYIASGTEKYIIIGNFDNDSNTDTLNVGGGLIDKSYYFIDDVSVIDSSAIGINEINNNTNITIYPNPSNGNIQVDLSKLNEGGDLQFVVYNTLGIEIKKQQIIANEITSVDLSDLANGTYFYKVFKDGKLYKYDKLVLIK